MSLNHIVTKVVMGLMGIAVVFGTVGCGVVPPLPAAFPNLTLSVLEEVQSDERLTDDQKRTRIRELSGAPDNDSGDRLVEFLLNFSVP